MSSTLLSTILKDSAMRHSQTSRRHTTFAKTILAFAAIGFASACSSDSVSAPTAAVSARVPAQYTTVLGAMSFTYDPAAGLTQRMGNHVLVIPSYGVCDLSSTYGVGHWDDDCAPATSPITITATMFADDNGSPYIEFQPALRFVPSKETDLYLKDGRRDHGQDVTITYCTLTGCVDESLTDPSLVTQRVGKTRIAVRRIKHFSGYNIGAGDTCNGTIVEDPEGGLLCVEDDSGLGRRSGYMLATGLNKDDDTQILPRRRRDNP